MLGVTCASPRAGFRLGDERYLGDRRHFSFVVLRDPLERIVSAYAYIFVRPLQWRTYPDLPGRAVSAGSVPA